MKPINMLFNEAFIDHPASVDETYVEHMGVALAFSGRLFIAALMCLLHGLVPCCFKKSASRQISRLYDQMVLNR